MTNILIVHYSLHGGTKKVAMEIAKGVKKAGGTAVVRTVPKVSPATEQTEPAVPDAGAPYVTKEEIAAADGFAFGSPTRFGNMAAAMKYFFDGLIEQWSNGALEGKPAGVFNSTHSLHGGHEGTCLSMMVPLLHLGMLPVGVPYSVKGLNETTDGGGPYGPSHSSKKDELSDSEAAIAQALGARLVHIGGKLK